MPLSSISIEKQLHYAEKGEQGGVDVREPSTALLGISSVDRYRAGLLASQVNPLTNTLGASTLTSPYDFQITTPAQNLMAGFFTRLAVNEVQFRWTIPTITTRNNRLYINVSPLSNSSLASASHSGSQTTFTLTAPTTGYAAGQTVSVLSSNVNGQVLTGIYTIISTAGSTIVCNDPNNLTDFGTTAAFGNVYIRGLVAVPEGWYDLNNQDITSASRAGNLAYQFQEAVKAVPLMGTLLTGFVCVYTLNYQGAISNPGSVVTAVGQPYNTFFASNLASSGASPFFFSRFSDPIRTNAVSLFEMMAWGGFQNRAAFQYSSPNVSLLSTPFVDICCDGLTYCQSLKDGDSGEINRTMLCRVFLTPDAFTGNMANLGSNPILIHRAFPFPKQIRWQPNQPIGNLRFQVFDSQGYLLTTNDGLFGTPTNPPSYFDSDLGDWSMTLLVSEV
jgi:hypothetical protein